MDFFTPPQIVTIIVALIGAIGGILGYLKGRNKEKADVAKAITEAAGELVEDYQHKIDRIEKQLTEQSERVRCQEIKIDKQALQIDIQARKIREYADQLKAEQEARERNEAELDKQAAKIHVLELERDEILNGVMSLCTQIRRLGHEPVWEPEAPNNNS